MSYKTNNRGSLVIDKRYPAVGRIKRATGVHDHETYDKLVSMLDTLSDSGRIDLLKAIKNGSVNILEVWEKYRTQSLSALPAVENVIVLFPKVYDWIDRHHVGDDTKKNYRSCWKKLENIKKDATINDLPMMLTKLRDQCKKQDILSTFNHTKVAASSFVLDQFGKGTALYTAINAIKGFPYRRKREGNPQSVVVIQQIMKDIPEVYAQMIWDLCMTGMRPRAEYCKKLFEVKKDRIIIRGTKTKNAVRTIPLFDTPIHPVYGDDALARNLTIASKGTVQLYDLRRTAIHWWEMAGIPRTRRMMYAGHAVGDVHSLYEYHEVERFLKEDAEKLQAYIKKESSKGNPNAGAFFE